MSSTESPRTRSSAAWRHNRKRIIRLIGFNIVLAVVLTGLSGQLTGTHDSRVSLAASVGNQAVYAPEPEVDGHVPAKDMHDGTQDAAYDIIGGVKVFHLTAAPITWNTGLGGPRTAFAFNGMIPGPNIRVNQGDRVRIIVTNQLPENTAVHWHGMILPNDQDGVPDLTQPPILPGQAYTYEWTAVVAGTHWYHSHMDGGQEGRGLYGALEVVPSLGDIPADYDYRIETGDGALGFVFNGKSFPSTTSLYTHVGQRVHIRLIDTGPEMVHAIHMHGGPFQIVAQDGFPLPSPQWADTVTISPGQTFDLIWTPQMPGKWMLHCHIFSHSETPQGMQGMVTIMEVDPPVVPLPLLVH